MIQTHQQLLKIGEEYNTLFSQNEFYPIQKAYTTPHFLVLGMRFPGQNVVLYIGRGNQYEGIFMSNKFPPSYLRIQDRLLDYVRKYLVGARLGKMEVDEKHFMSLFHFKNDHTDNSFSFGYKDRQLFFIKQWKEEIYTSWNGETSSGKNIADLVDKFLGEKSTVESSRASSWSLENYFAEEQKKVSGKPVQKKKEKFLEKKLHNIGHDLESAQKWQQMEEEMLSEDDELVFGENQSVFHGHKIKFGSQLNHWQKRDVVFGKIKKLKKAEEILKNRLQETGEELSKVKIGEFEFEVTKEKAIAPLWQTGKTTKTKNESEHNIKNFQLKKLFGTIALDAESNDWLRSQGSKDHYWFHVENYPGAHCLIKTDDVGVLSGEDLSAIASMLRDYSQLEITEIPVIYSQLKNVKGLKGAQGKVLIKKPRYLRCNYIKWTEIITVV
jgi:predicted ribosome quality control (RQC) complex YloA/Tae2 family protein